MKKGFKTVLIVAVFFLVVVFMWRAAYSMRKSNDNLPSIEKVAQMSEAEVNDILSGYKIFQLREVWGEADISKNNTDIWKSNGINIVVSYKNNGVVAVCAVENENTV